MAFPLVQGIPQWMGWVYGVIALVAAITDYRAGKIYNWLTLPALVFGIVVAFVLAGLSAGAAALVGAALAAALFIPLFLSGVLGGGDVKLVMAMGTVLGARGTFELICISIMIAAAGALVLLFVHKRAGVFVRELHKFLTTVFTPGLKLEWPRLSRDIQAPFGIAIFIGFVYLMGTGA